MRFNSGLAPRHIEEKRLKQVANREVNSISNPMAFRISPGHFKSCSGNIRRINIRRDISRARATATQPNPYRTSAIVSECSRRAPIRSRETSTKCSVSGRGISTSRVTSNSNPQNFLFASEILRRHASTTFDDQCRVKGRLIGAEAGIWIRVKPGAVAPQHVISNSSDAKSAEGTSAARNCPRAIRSSERTSRRASSDFPLH